MAMLKKLVYLIYISSICYGAIVEPIIFEKNHISHSRSKRDDDTQTTASTSTSESSTTLQSASTTETTPAASHVPNPSWSPGSASKNECTNSGVLEKLSNLHSSNYDLKDDNPSVAIAWHGVNTGVLLAVTTRDDFLGDLMGNPNAEKLKSQHASNIYISYDYGSSFKQVDYSRFVKADGITPEDDNIHIRKKQGVINSNNNSVRVILIKQENAFARDLYFSTISSTGADQKKGSTIWINDNVTSKTSKWIRRDLEFTIDGGVIEPHPTKDTHLLCKGVGLADEHSLYMTTDGGNRWRKVSNNVHRYRWDPHRKISQGHQSDDDSAFYFTMDPDGRFNQYEFNFELWRAEHWSSDKAGSSNLIAVRVYSFGVQEEFIYVSVLYPQSDKNKTERIMMVSNDHGYNLQAVQLPAVDKDRFYAILDCTENMIFMHVDETGDTGFGTLFTSDNRGLVFDESLRKHLYPNTGDVTDFYKIEAFAFEGTYITSRLLPEMDNSVVSVISYDKGISWNSLDNILGTDEEKKCSDTTCNLQLHNRFSISKHVHVPKTIVSSKSAPGIIMAHGNLGDALASTDVNVFVSKDGGYTWKKSLSGQHDYQILDHGNIFVAIESLNPRDRMVDTIKISFDQGDCWVNYKFAEEKIEYTGMIIEPGERQAKLAIWGWGGITTENPSGNWVIYHIDLSEVMPKCTKDDFELTKAHCSTKSKGGSGKDVCCRLGAVTTYYQKKNDIHCIHGYDKTETNIASHSPCECQLDDLQCDFGYTRQNENDGNSQCILDDSHNKILGYDICYGPASNPGQTLGHHIPSTQYRKLPGDKCKWGGSLNKLDYIKTVTPIFKKCKPEDLADVAIHSSEKYEGDCLEVDKYGKCTKFKTIDQVRQDTEIDDYYNGDLHVESLGDYETSFIDRQQGLISGKGNTQKGSSTLLILMSIVLVAFVCGCTYYFYVKGNRLPGVLARFHRYSAVNDLIIEEDEPPLDLTSDRYRPVDRLDDDDILA